MSFKKRPFEDVILGASRGEGLNREEEKKEDDNEIEDVTRMSNLNKLQRNERNRTS